MSKVAFLPTIFAIGVALLGLGLPVPGSTFGTPWMIAVHNQTMADGTISQVDTMGMFLWGQQYTVVGVDLIQNQITTYDTRDFPFYSYIMMLIGIIAGVLALTVDRTYRIGKYSWTNKLSPINPLIVATIITALATVYLYIAANSTIVPMFATSGYIARYAIGIQFMDMSVIGFVISLILTYSATISQNKIDKRNEVSALGELCK
jgi:hypothetical protein